MIRKDQENRRDIMDLHDALVAGIESGASNETLDSIWDNVINLHKGRKQLYSSVRASEDVKGIAEFNFEKFGVQQANVNRQDLTSRLNNLTANPDINREYIAIKGNMVSRYRFKAHTLFFYSMDSNLFVVRILGNKMDFLKYF